MMLQSSSYILKVTCTRGDFRGLLVCMMFDHQLLNKVEGLLVPHLIESKTAQNMHIDTF